MSSLVNAGTVNRKRTLRAPSPHAEMRPPALLSIELEDDEDVRWHWTHFADGRSMVTGYTIVKRSKVK